jgi:hypothetical protein
MPSRYTDHPTPGTRVEVYWNLHAGGWSVRDCKTGRVICRVTPDDGLLDIHYRSIHLTDVRWVVQPAGNRRVREEGRKNVHAFARGVWAGYSNRVPELVSNVRYNPYHMTTFQDLYGNPVEGSDVARLGFTRRSQGHGPAAQAFAMT